MLWSLAAHRCTHTHKDREGEEERLIYAPSAVRRQRRQPQTASLVPRGVISHMAAASSAEKAKERVEAVETSWGLPLRLACYGFVYFYFFFALFFLQNHLPWERVTDSRDDNPNPSPQQQRFSSTSEAVAFTRLSLSRSLTLGLNNWMQLAELTCKTHKSSWRAEHWIHLQLDNARRQFAGKCLRLNCGIFCSRNDYKRLNLKKLKQ